MQHSEECVKVTQEVLGGGWSLTFELWPLLQLSLTIHRQTGGLGISIAGGKGSTPYKGDDEVKHLLSFISGLG